MSQKESKKKCQSKNMPQNLAPPQSLSQDDSYDVVVTVVGRVGFDFSIFLGTP